MQGQQGGNRAPRQSQGEQAERVRISTMYITIVYCMECMTYTCTCIMYRYEYEVKYRDGSEGYLSIKVYIIHTFLCTISCMYVVSLPYCVYRICACVDSRSSWVGQGMQGYRCPYRTALWSTDPHLIFCQCREASG